jgi:ribonuclease P protein component
LTKSSDIQRVRRLGKSYAHPLIVLIALSNDTGISRFAVIAGRSVGNAVQRNRAKRMIREAVRSFLPMIAPGWDVILLARKPITAASSQQLQESVGILLKRSRLMDLIHE